MTTEEFVNNQKFIKSEPISILGDKDVIYLLEEFARIKWDEACEAQREECAKQELTKLTSTGICSNREAVLNAPKPEYK
jgi:hypothetical protein